jgi:glycerol-3-phosphate acyltransferase PlsY
MSAWLPWLLVPATYLLASVSFAYWAGRINGKDLRKEGSGNLGATNAGRVLGKQWFFAVFACDLAKGMLPVLWADQIARASGSTLERLAPSVADWADRTAGTGGHPLDWLPLAVAAAAVLGHIFTCFHGFKGGKAVATSLGVLIGLVWVVAAMSFAVWLVVWTIGIVAFGKKPSEAVGPASVFAAIAAPIIRQFTHPRPWADANLAVTVFILLVACVVVVRHRSNIAKMLKRG